MADDVATSLDEKVRAVFAEWIAENGLTTSMPRSWCLVVEGVGFDGDGAETETVMIVPNGSSISMVGLLDNALTRFRAEVVSGLFGGAS